MLTSPQYMQSVLAAQGSLLSLICAVYSARNTGAETLPISCHLTCKEKHSKYKVEAMLAGCKGTFLPGALSDIRMDKQANHIIFPGKFKNSNSLLLLEWW